MSRLKFVAGSLTSQWAAEQNEPNAGTQRWRVLDELRRYPSGLTDHELQEYLQMNPSTERPRRIELCEMQLVRATNELRPTPSGRLAIVWAATPIGPTVDIVRVRPKPRFNFFR
jgi:hypothetical protein